MLHPFRTTVKTEETTHVLFIKVVLVLIPVQRKKYIYISFNNISMNFDIELNLPGTSLSIYLLKSKNFDSHAVFLITQDIYNSG